jgi:predicted O-linked N-acetylglucosamine transferase (SPINDLY family)
LSLQQAYELAAERVRAGDWDQAESLARQILSHHPDHPAALHLLDLLAGSYLQSGNALLMQRQNDQAIEAYRRAIALRPTYPGAWSNLGKVMEDLGRADEAIEAYRKAIEANPDFAEVHFNLGNALRTKDDLDGAIAEYKRAIELRANHAASHSNLGNALKDAGRVDEAIASYRRAWDLGADARGAGNLLYSLYLHPDFDARQIYEEHVRWSQRYARGLAPAADSFSNDPSPDRRLRVGYVSPDFSVHPVGRFMLPILSHHDRERFEIVCYSDVRVGDSVTVELRKQAHVWRETSDVADAELAARIREEQIDILIDLSLHTSRNRLRVFARKPAPAQATYLSYPGTSGLETMDYRLTDPHLDPPSAAAFYSERSICLPRTYWCYGVPHVTAEVAPPPSLTAGRVTFGCFNQFCKISRPALDAWCELLRAVPDSRLILLAHEGSTRDLARESVRSRGIDPTRLEFVGRVSLQDYLDRHRLIDIALDPFPFTGGTTTCDALWMGVPVVTLRGDRAVARGGASILANAGLPELIAGRTDQYVRIASSLAADLPRLADLRANLRQRLLASPLMDAHQFTRDLEQAYRQMWERSAAG